MAAPVPSLTKLAIYPRMTGWFGPLLLLKLLGRVVVSDMFGQYADRRLILAALDTVSAEVISSRLLFVLCLVLSLFSGRLVVSSFDQSVRPVHTADDEALRTERLDRTQRHFNIRPLFSVVQHDGHRTGNRAASPWTAVEARAGGAKTKPIMNSILARGTIPSSQIF
jgi:hypothetical protein